MHPKNLKRSFFACAAAALLAMAPISSAQARQDKTEAIEPPPAATRQFRGAWVATVGNIDWPSKPGLPVEQQKEEVTRILDRLVELNMNVAVLQVRTAADALYDSKLEPWSYVITGKEGQAPEPYYDPLEFWVAEAHKRGIELHTWFNPYRARVGKLEGDKWAYEHADSHVAKAHADWVRTYVKFEWIDPGSKEALEHTLDVISDVVKRYDIDGVHMDDYFYPYPDVDPTTKKELPFPDDETWKQYQQSGGTLDRDDWRRDNVNRMVEQLYEHTKKEKKWVKVGLSPFGIWKEGFPSDVAGFSQYHKLYADAKLWLNKGWIDYWTPQLYWKISYPQQNYLSLLNWWIGENTHKRLMVPGLFTGQIDNGGAIPWTTDAILDQIGINRALDGAHGEVHFPMNALMRNQGNIGDMMLGQRGVYTEQVLMPAYPWLDGTPPPAPTVALAKAPESAAVQTVATTKPTTRANGEGRRGRRQRVQEPPAATTGPATTQVTTAKGYQPLAPIEQPERSGCFQVSWKAAEGEPAWQWAVYTRVGKKWTMHVYPAGTTDAVFYDAKAAKTADPKSTMIDAVAVAAVDRNGNESKRTVVPRPADVVTPIAPRPATEPTTQPKLGNGLDG
jgi:uncharacterized lipoprotein YddW (UPF0748 family)